MVYIPRRRLYLLVRGFGRKLSEKRSIPMTVIENKTFDEERALYASQDVLVRP